MANLHPFACGCATCRGPRRTPALPRARRTFGIAPVIAILGLVLAVALWAAGVL